MPTAEAPPVDAGFAGRQTLIREDYELDLRVFFRTLFRQWLLVAACVVLALGAAVLAVYLQPRNYLAVSQVFIQRPKTNLGIEPRFITEDTFEIRPFFTHVKHPDVERAVQDRLRAQLSDAELSKDGLIERIRTRAHREDPALLEIQFVDPDPYKAAALANAWAEAFVEHARTALNPAAQVQRMVDGQLAESRAELQQRDDAVRQFAQQAGIGISLREDSPRVEISTLAPSGQPAAAPTTSRLGTRGRDLSARTATLNETRAARDRLRIVLAQAQALRSAGLPLGAIANDLAQVGVPAGRPTGAPETAISGGADEAIRVLEARERALGESIDRLAAEVHQLESTLAADLASLERLERERDVARDAYIALAKKAEENKIALASEWPAVSVFNRSPEPAPAEPRPWAIYLGLAAAAGLIVGLIGAFVADHRRAAGAAARAARLDALAERAL